MRKTLLDKLGLLQFFAKKSATRTGMRTEIFKYKSTTTTSLVLYTIALAELIEYATLLRTVVLLVPIKQ